VRVYRTRASPPATPQPPTASGTPDEGVEHIRRAPALTPEDAGERLGIGTKTLYRIQSARLLCLAKRHSLP